MSQYTSATPPGLDAPTIQSFPLEEGQNHDRMETDIPSDDSRSEGGVPEPPGGAADPNLMEVEPPEDGEIMDTRPDSVTPEAPPVTGGLPTSCRIADGCLVNVIQQGKGLQLAMGHRPRMLQPPAIQTLSEFLRMEAA